MKTNDKTNAMRILEQKKIQYTAHTYEPDATMSGAYYVFVIPVKEELDLKKAAKSAGEKAVSMIKQKELLPLTGYVHGGCSPVGMKKQFPTFMHETALQCDKIFVSAGRVGFQVELSPSDLKQLIQLTYVDLTD